MPVPVAVAVPQMPITIDNAFGRVRSHAVEREVLFVFLCRKEHSRFAFACKSIIFGWCEARRARLKVKTLPEIDLTQFCSNGFATQIVAAQSNDVSIILRFDDYSLTRSAIVFGGRVNRRPLWIIHCFGCQKFICLRCFAEMQAICQQLRCFADRKQRKWRSSRRQWIICGFIEMIISFSVYFEIALHQRLLAIGKRQPSIIAVSLHRHKFSSQKHFSTTSMTQPLITSTGARPTEDHYVRQSSAKCTPNRMYMNYSINDRSRDKTEHSAGVGAFCYRIQPFVCFTSNRLWQLVLLIRDQCHAFLPNERIQLPIETLRAKFAEKITNRISFRKFSVWTNRLLK